jgi:hypothetical protein
LAEAETRLRRLQAAIEAGADPAALIDPLNRAQERVMAARLERDQAPSSQSLGRGRGRSDAGLPVTSRVVV